ncbi:Arabinose metabolism transcriptional repressor [compost metagenome]
MGQYILSQGHMDIAYFGVSHKDEAVGIHRKQGFLQAMEDHGLSNIPFVETSFSIEDAEQKAKDYLTHASEMKQKPTIIACATDNIALGVMKAANQLQIPIPAELSISGFGGYDVSQIVQPNLTTIKYDYEATGVQAASSLIQQVEGQEKAPPQLHVMNYELFIKESVDNKNLYARM